MSIFFIHDIETYRFTETGFKETVVRCTVRTYGEIASCVTLSEAHVPGDKRPPQQGVDAFHLIRQTDGWKIVSIVNEVVWPGRPGLEEFVPKE